MTFETLKKVIDNNHIPYDVELWSDSGWECDPTEMDGIWYSSKENAIVFTQDEHPTKEIERLGSFNLLYVKSNG